MALERVVHTNQHGRLSFQDFVGVGDVAAKSCSPHLDVFPHLVLESRSKSKSGFFHRAEPEAFR